MTLITVVIISLLVLLFFSLLPGKQKKRLFFRARFLPNPLKAALFSFYNLTLTNGMAYSKKEISDALDHMERLAKFPTVQRGLKLVGMTSVSDWYWNQENIIKNVGPTLGERQQPYWYYPGLRARKFWPTEEFGWVQDLENNYHIIKNELENVLHKKDGFQPYRVIENNKFLKTGGKGYTSDPSEIGWMMFYLWHNGEVTEHTALCPQTAQLLKVPPLTNRDKIQPH